MLENINGFVFKRIIKHEDSLNKKVKLENKKEFNGFVYKITEKSNLKNKNIDVKKDLIKDGKKDYKKEVKKDIKKDGKKDGKKEVNKDFLEELKKDFEKDVKKDFQKHGKKDLIKKVNKDRKTEEKIIDNKEAKDLKKEEKILEKKDEKKEKKNVISKDEKKIDNFTNPRNAKKSIRVEFNGKEIIKIAENNQIKNNHIKDVVKLNSNDIEQNVSDKENILNYQNKNISNDKKTIEQVRKTPKKEFIAKIKEPTPFRFDKNDLFMDIKTPKKSIFYNENFLLNSQHTKKLSTFSRFFDKKKEFLIPKDLSKEDEIKFLLDEILDNVDFADKSKLREIIKNFKFKDVYINLINDFKIFINEYKNDIEEINFEMEKWKRIKENVFLDNKCVLNYNFEEKNEYLANLYIIGNISKKNIIDTFKDKIKEEIKLIYSFKNKSLVEIEKIKDEINILKDKIYDKIEYKNKIDPIALCKAMSKL